MALEISYCINNKNNCKTLALTDSTGVESATNTTGWGLSNPISDVAAATFLIEKRNADGTYSTLSTVDVYDTLPNVLGTPFLLTSINFGLEAEQVIPDGIYRGTYTVYDDADAVLSTFNKTFAVTCSIKCCFKKLSDKAAFQTCPSDIKEKFDEMTVLMRGLEAASQDCGDVIVLNNLIEYLGRLCSSCGCQCE